MPDYNHLRELCEQNSTLSSAIIDDFILYYAAKQDKLSREFDTRAGKYKHVVKLMPEVWFDLIKSQYIIHRVFKKGGLVTKYLNHSAVKKLEPEHQEYLRFAAANSWEFVFSRIVSNPAPDFYEMEDVFTGKKFLLFSELVTMKLETDPVLTWFNLIANNGDCYQSFGPVIGFQSFDADDLYFFATELNEKIEDFADMSADLEANPVPYMMLASGENHPLLISGEHELVMLTGEGNPTAIDKNVFDELESESVAGVFCITDPELSEPPHSCFAYYDEMENSSLLIASTEYGYKKFIKKLEKYNFELPEEPEIRLHPSMSETIQLVLKKEIVHDPYEYLIEDDPDSGDDLDVGFDKLQKFLNRIMPEILDEKIPDIDSIAKELDIDVNEANKAYQIIMRQREYDSEDY